MTETSLPRNPFVGLRPFESEDNLYYFGRKKQLRALLERLHQTRFLSIVGSSGAGKSSLVRAGLIPNLEAGFLIQDRDLWKIAKMKPGGNPLHNLAVAMHQALAMPSDTLEEFFQAIRQEGITALIRTIQPALNAFDANMLLLVDQFEEIFRYRYETDQDHAEEFMGLLLRLIEQNDCPIFVCLTMRSDFLGDCDQFYGLPEAMNRSQYLVPRLTRQQRQEAILGPLQLAKYEITPRLLDRLLNESGENRDDLPLLQHVLMRTWERCVHEGRNTLDIPDYKQVFTISQALDKHLSEVLTDLEETDQDRVKRLFQTITEIDSENRLIRRPKHLYEIANIIQIPAKTLSKLIDTFRVQGRNFLVLSTESQSQNPLVDISHESLIRQWKTLGAWVEEESEAATIYRRLAETAVLYEQGQAALYHGRDLQIALQWKEGPFGYATWAEQYHPDYHTARRFLLKSEEQEAVQLHKQLRQQKEREALLEEKARVSETLAQQQQKALRNFRLLTIIVTVFLVLALLAAGFAFRSSQEAEKQKDIAIQKSLEAEANRIEAEKQKDIAIRKILEAEANRTEAAKQRDLAIQKSEEAKTNRVEAEKQKEITFQKSEEAKKQAFAANYNLAKFYEAKALNAFNAYSQTQNLNDLKHGLLFTGAALTQDIPSDLSLIEPELIQQLFDSQWFHDFSHEKWVSRLQDSHKSDVHSVAFSPDGQLIASASQDRTIRLWSPTTGEIINILKGHRNTVNAVAFSKDGQVIASASRDKTVRLWNRHTGKLIKTISGHWQSASDVAFSPDGATLASASSNAVFLWDQNTGSNLRILRGHTGHVYSVAFSPNGELIASASADQTVRVWNQYTGDHQATFRGHKNLVFSVDFSPGGKFIASSSADGTVRLWNRRTLKTEKTLEGNFDSTRSITFAPKGQVTATGSDDNAIYLWHRQTGEILKTLKGHQDTVRSVDFSPNGELVVSASADNTVRLWDRNFFNPPNILKGHRSPVYGVAFSPDGELVASSSVDNDIYLWDRKTGGVQRILEGHRNTINHVAFSPDGNIIASASHDDTVRLWNPKTGKLLKTLRGHQGDVYGVDFSPNQKLIVTASNDDSVRLWDYETGALLSVLENNRSNVRSVAFSPEGNLIAFASDDNTVRLWDWENKKIQRILRGHWGNVNSVTFSPDGNLIASASSDNTVRLWNWADGSTHRVIHGHQSSVLEVAFSPDGELVASASFDNTVRLWDRDTGQPLNIFRGHQSNVWGVAFSPDGKLIASASSDDSVRLWNLEPFLMFLKDGKATPLYKAFYAGLQFALEMKVEGLEIVRSSEPPPLFPPEAYESLTRPPPPGQNRYEQILEWAKQQLGPQE